MPEDLKLSQIGSSQLPPPFRGLHSPGVRKHCQIIFACYIRKSSIPKLGQKGQRSSSLSPPPPPILKLGREGQRSSLLFSPILKSGQKGQRSSLLFFASFSDQIRKDKGLHYYFLPHFQIRSERTKVFITIFCLISKLGQKGQRSSLLFFASFPNQVRKDKGLHYYFLPLFQIRSERTKVFITIFASFPN